MNFRKKNYSKTPNKHFTTKTTMKPFTERTILLKLAQKGHDKGRKSGVVDASDDDIIYPDSRQWDDNYYSNERPHNHEKKKKRKEIQKSQKSELLLMKHTNNSQIYDKSDRYQKDMFNFRISKLPTHYESFQTNPEIDILTFDENVEVEIGGDQEKNYQSMESKDDGIGGYNNGGNNFGADTHRRYFDWKYDEYGGDRRHAHDVMNEETKSEPFFVDDKLFDVKSSDEDYHRKELVQDMRRILANGPENTHIKKGLNLVVDEYDYENDDSSQEDASKFTTNGKIGERKSFTLRTEISSDLTEDKNYSTEPTKTVKAEGKAISNRETKSSNAFDTQTDWSLLKKMQLPADHKSQLVGVRKNFGACFAGKDSYFHYNDAETMSQVISYNIDLNLRIKTHSENGVILWTGRQGATEENADYLSLGIEDGHLHFCYDLGSGEVDIKFNTSRVSDGLWHRVRAFRDSQAGYLEIDGRKTATLKSPGKLKQLNTDTGLYVGGMPDEIYFTRRKYLNGIVGCISEIVLAGELKLNFDPNTLGTAHNVETGLL